MADGSRGHLVYSSSISLFIFFFSQNRERFIARPEHTKTDLTTTFYIQVNNQVKSKKSERERERQKRDVRGKLFKSLKKKIFFNKLCYAIVPALYPVPSPLLPPQPLLTVFFYSRK